MNRPSNSKAVPDFQRRVYCVMGLPFDALDMDDAVAKVRQAVSSRTRCLLVTPNLNFIAEGTRDPAFRDMLLEGDLSLADGMPLIWVARLLQIPLPKRVSGADLFDTMSVTPADPKLSVYMFGGGNGVAARAGERLARASSGLRCVGAMEPPFGSAEELSQRPVIEAINAANADFLVIALGARKGHEWIRRNQWELNPVVISHLGAVIKYTAGEVARAPRWVQELGLEWLWRVKEEPQLWRRYLNDAFIVGRLLFGRTLPVAVHTFVARTARALTGSGQSAPEVVSTAAGDVQSLRLGGAWYEHNSAPLRAAMARVAAQPGNLRVDLSAVTAMDSAVVALLLLLRGHCLRRGVGLELIHPSAAARRCLKLHGAEYLLEPVPTRLAATAAGGESGWISPQFPSPIERAD